MKRAPAANTAEKPAASAERDPKRPAPGIDVEAATRVVLASLEDDKAEEIISIDIRGKSSFADMLVVASGRSARHVGALADHVMRKLKEAGVPAVVRDEPLLVHAFIRARHMSAPARASFDAIIAACGALAHDGKLL